MVLVSDMNNLESYVADFNGDNRVSHVKQLGIKDHYLSHSNACHSSML